MYSLESFSGYMNMFEAPVEVGCLYRRNDLLIDNSIYKVVGIELKDGKYYALCEYEDGFSGSIRQELVYAYNLEKI